MTVRIADLPRFFKSDSERRIDRVIDYFGGGMAEGDRFERRATVTTGWHLS